MLCSNLYLPPKGQALGQPQEYERHAGNVNKELGYDMSDDIIAPLQGQVGLEVVPHQSPHLEREREREIQLQHTNTSSESGYSARAWQTLITGSLVSRFHSLVFFCMK